MVNLLLQQDCWTVVTSDDKLSAHLEYSIAITENGFLSY